VPGHQIKQILKYFPGLKVLQRAIEIHVHQAAQIPRQIVPINLAQLNGHPEHTGGDLLFVAGHQIKHQIREILPVLERQTAHLPEIDETDHIVGQDEHIARMGIGMEKTMDKDLLHHQIGAALGNQREIVPLFAQGFDSGRLDA
jgi:hypothetical protein